jgi:hypothetical protein
LLHHCRPSSLGHGAPLKDNDLISSLKVSM